MKILFLYLLNLNLQASAQTQPPLLMSSFSVLQNLVEQIAPPSSRIETLVPLEADPHDYKLSIQDMMKFKNVKLYFYFGYGVDDHITSNIEIKNKCQVSKNLKLITDIKQKTDPHAWQDPQMGILIAEQILLCLKLVFPDQIKTMEQKFKKLNAELNQISSEYIKLYGKLPSQELKLVTTHAAFQYLEKPFQLQILSIQGLDSHSEPSARSLQNLIDQIKLKKIRYLFPEKEEVSSTFKRLATLTSLKIAPRIYSDTLSDSSGPASSYQKMVRHNLESIYQALKTKDDL